MHMLRKLGTIIAAAITIPSAEFDVSILKTGNTWEYLYTDYNNFMGSVTGNSGTITYTIDSTSMFKDSVSIYFTVISNLLINDSMIQHDEHPSLYTYTYDSSANAQRPPPFLWGAAFQGEISTVIYGYQKEAKPARMVEQNKDESCRITSGRYIEGVGQLEYNEVVSGCQISTWSYRYVLIKANGIPIMPQSIVSVLAKNIGKRKGGTSKKSFPGTIRMNNHDFNALGKLLN